MNPAEVRDRAGRGRVVIVGAGIAGLAAAYFLRDLSAEVIVLEAAGRTGGKLTVSEVAGIPVDAGAEALLARRPEGVDLIEAVGLGGDLVYPGTTAGSIWTRGQFRALPRRQFMGVPADFADLERSAILSPAGLERARQDAQLPATQRADDVTVAEYVGARFGAEVVDRLVDPLLGGVYAGRSDQLSFDATIPALAQAARENRSLAVAAESLLSGADRPPPGEPAAGKPLEGQPPEGQPPEGRPQEGRPPPPRRRSSRRWPGASEHSLTRWPARAAPACGPGRRCVSSRGHRTDGG